MDKIKFIALVRHIGWVAYQIGVNQQYNKYPTEDQLSSLMQGVEFALKTPNATPEENHKNWMKMKLSQGWKYGEVKDLRRKTHPDLVPFDELPDVEKNKDIMDKIINDLGLNLWKGLNEN